MGSSWFLVCFSLRVLQAQHSNSLQLLTPAFLYVCLPACLCLPRLFKRDVMFLLMSHLMLCPSKFGCQGCMCVDCSPCTLMHSLLLLIWHALVPPLQAGGTTLPCLRVWCTRVYGATSPSSCTARPVHSLQWSLPLTLHWGYSMSEAGEHHAGPLLRALKAWARTVSRLKLATTDCATAILAFAMHSQQETFLLLPCTASKKHPPSVSNLIYCFCLMFGLSLAAFQHKLTSQ